MPKARFWCFTSHSEVCPIWNGLEMSYLTYQQEKGEETGKLHWQGYLELKKSGTQKQIKTLIGNQSHVEPSRSAAAIAYCHKEETRVDGPWEFGEKSKPLVRGSRSDLNEFGKRARERGGNEKIAESDPGMFIRYHRGFDALRKISIKSRDWSEAACVRVYIGDSGSGKTRSVFTEFGADEIYTKDGSTKWWDGYDAQACILIDDFVGSEAISIPEILTICDRYKKLVETKGGHVWLAKAVIIFTTTLEISQWYRNQACLWSTKVDDFMRRVTEVRRFSQTEEL